MKLTTKLPFLLLTKMKHGLQTTKMLFYGLRGAMKNFKAAVDKLTDMKIRKVKKPYSRSVEFSYINKSINVIDMRIS